MNRFAILSTTLATALAAMPAPMPAEAATGGALLRCQSPDGTIGYTDRSCAVFGAQAVPIDADLVVRITRDRARADLAATAAGAEPGFDMDSAMLVGTADRGGTSDGKPSDALQDLAAPGRRSPATGCARNPAQLATDLHASIALGDVNRIAESYHFAGMSTDAGERVLDRLQRYAGRPVVDSHYYAASIGPAAMGDTAGGSQGMVQLVLAGRDGAGTSVEFEVERYADCYFVSFA
jgi:hypothetical protein